MNVVRVARTRPNCVKYPKSLKMQVMYARYLTRETLNVGDITQLCDE